MGGPVVVVEQRVAARRVRQWLMDDRGLRYFDFRGSRATGWGPPVTTKALGDDFAVVVSLVRARFGLPDEPGWPGPPPPREEVDRITNTVGLVSLLEQHWAASRTDPPPNLTPHDVRQAMSGAEITVGNLLQSGI